MSLENFIVSDIQGIVITKRGNKQTSQPIEKVEPDLERGDR